jgi:hypothetical protein
MKCRGLYYNTTYILSITSLKVILDCYSISHSQFNIVMKSKASLPVICQNMYMSTYVCTYMYVPM